MNRLIFILFTLFNLISADIYAASAGVTTGSNSNQGYELRTIEQEANAFFGEASEGLAKALEEAFKVRGKPNAYIKGQELSASLTVGVRYGDGSMKYYGKEDSTKLFWQGPSVGFDQGLNCSKVFILVYNLNEIDDIFRGFPGLETNLFYYAGISVTYLEANGIVLVPIRIGMGMRTGINIGYLRFADRKSVV